MQHIVIALVAILSLMTHWATSVSAGDDMLASYTARLGPADHFNSKGVRLTSAAAIIRQDRANFHKFGVVDPEDEPDRFFASIANRAKMEMMLSAGNASDTTLSRIVNGQPLIHVIVYRDYIDIAVD